MTSVHQQPLFESQPDGQSEPVECLEMVFANDTDRRAYFTELLREKLQDLEFRKIEGFPIGEDEDILALSDPPYYTACPNPWLSEFVARWEAEKPVRPPNYLYQREPFAADVSEGKYDPIYKYHPYPTKVPHKAIMRYILHYTEPGDIVFDGFCGTGMTGVAAHLCGDRREVESLGYKVEANGAVFRQDLGEDGTKRWIAFSKLGARRAVLNDLSPSATFIAYNYNTPVNVAAFEKEAKRILRAVEKECDWMYETHHTDGRIGKVNYTVWSDVFVCPECTEEVVFWEAAVDKAAGKVLKEFFCPHCSARLNKLNLERAWVTVYDSTISQTVQQAKQKPVLINYSVGKKRFQKAPDQFDLALLEKIEKTEIPYWYPSLPLPEGDKTGEPLRIGVTHTHHFYSRRNLYSLASFLDKIEHPKQKLFITKLSYQITKLYRFTYQSGVWGAGGGPLSGTLYVPSLVKELRILKQLHNALKSRTKIATPKELGTCVGTTQSATSLGRIAENSADYAFIDPPFGSNLNYSELAFLWESWLRTRTDNLEEAIENKTQGKGINEYRNLMTRSFRSLYQNLKPGRWVTVEFSNTKASVWNSIQTSLIEAGFIVANVSALDKKKRSYNAQTNPTSVKQDLVISVYKPNGGFEKRFHEHATSEDGAWDFVRTHLRYLPVVKRQTGAIVTIPERDPRILFDQMVAYYVRKHYPVPLSSQEFQLGLTQRFPERDGMYFLPEQVAEYDKARLAAEELVQASLFVSDEDSSIQWLRQLLKTKPQVFADINPQYMRQLGGWSKYEEQLDLRELLSQNFLRYDGHGEVPSQIHSYLSSNYKDMRNLPKDDTALREMARDRWYVPDPNKAADLEKLREKGLLREFDTYSDSKQRRLKVFRLEAVRAGFKRAWQEGDYETIITVARKIPDNVLQEDPKLLMWYDQALTRTGQME